MPTQTITVPFRVVRRDDDHGFTYVDHEALSLSCYASSQSSAVAKLRPQLVAAVGDALVAVDSEHRRQWIIGAGDGSVFLVQYSLGSWGYRICGSGRSYACSSWASDSTMEDAIAMARTHAADAFGGVGWEHAL